MTRSPEIPSRARLVASTVRPGCPVLIAATEIERQGRRVGIFHEELSAERRDIEVVVGDGFAGVPDQAPYDRIIVTAAAVELPQTLIGQLAEGGVMLLPLGPHDEAQELVKLTKTNEGLKKERLIGVRFVPLLPGQAREL